MICYRLCYRKAVAGLLRTIQNPFNPALLLFLIEETLKFNAILQTNMKIKLFDVVTFG